MRTLTACYAYQMRHNGLGIGLFRKWITGKVASRCSLGQLVVMLPRVSFLFNALVRVTDTRFTSLSFKRRVCLVKVADRVCSGSIYRSNMGRRIFF